MKIQSIESQHRRDFSAIYECEHCGHTQSGHGYDDLYFHSCVIPQMECQGCGKTADSSYRPLSPNLKIRELQASIVYERVAWCHAALEVILWWHDQYEDGDGPPPAIRELERLHARHAGGIPDSDPQRQAEWIDARLDELYRMGADR